MNAMPSKPLSAIVVGAGPAGLMAADVLASAGWTVDVHDRMPSIGRKFLMAGRGGLNLTHSEPLDRLLARYGEAPQQVVEAIKAFPPADLIKFVEYLGEPTFVGSSGRVFPKSMKTSPLLRAWAKRLGDLGVRFHLRSRWIGWDQAGRPQFEDPTGVVATAQPDATILALGGASWPRLGSDAAWVRLFASDGVAVSPLGPSNCGIRIGWSDLFRARHAGEPLKRIAVTFGETRVEGEAIVTSEGLEGGVIYALSRAIRVGLAAGPIKLILDLRPGLLSDELVRELGKVRKGDTVTNVLRKAGLSSAAVGLMREARGRLLPDNPFALATAIKSAPVTVTAQQTIERAISSSGGVATEALDGGFMLTARPGVFVAGEMLDWDAPTGGYLLQASFATARAAAHAAIRWAEQHGAAACVDQTLGD